MTGYEITQGYNAKCTAARVAFENNYIDRDTYQNLLRKASEWRRKAEAGYWDEQDCRQEIRQRCA